MINIVKETKGMALVICLLIMTVAAMLGIGIATDSTIDGQISRNQRGAAKDFFISDGTNQIKIREIQVDGTGDLAPTNLDTPENVHDDNADDEDETLSDIDNLPNPPKFRAKIDYMFRRFTTGGFSVDGETSFKFYYYTTQTNARRNNRNQTGIKTTERKLGI